MERLKVWQGILDLGNSGRKLSQNSFQFIKWGEHESLLHIHYPIYTCMTLLEFAEIEMLLFGFERCFRLIRTFAPLFKDKIFAPFTKKSTVFAMC